MLSLNTLIWHAIQCHTCHFMAVPYGPIWHHPVLSAVLSKCNHNDWQYGCCHCQTAPYHLSYMAQCTALSNPNGSHFAAFGILFGVCNCGYNNVSWNLKDCEKSLCPLEWLHFSGDNCDTWVEAKRITENGCPQSSQLFRQTVDILLCIYLVIIMRPLSWLQASHYPAILKLHFCMPLWALSNGPKG